LPAEHCGVGGVDLHCFAASGLMNLSSYSYSIPVRAAPHFPWRWHLAAYRKILDKTVTTRDLRFHDRERDCVFRDLVGNNSSRSKCKSACGEWNPAKSCISLVSESWLARRDGTDGLVRLLDWYDRQMAGPPPRRPRYGTHSWSWQWDVIDAPRTCHLNGAYFLFP